MENASKALIIAGSVLLAIMLVALGVTIFNKARGAADVSSLDSAEITMFNQKFEKYASDKQLGSNVKTLISFAISNASTNKDDPIKLPKVVHTDGTTADSNADDYVSKLGEIRKEISSTHTYKVNVDYDTSTGLVSTITIND